MNFQVHFDIPVYLFLTFGVLSAGLSYLMYRKLEGISRPRQLFLGTLRGASFFLLFLAAANLVTDIVRVETAKRDVFLLLDDSKSMSLSDGSAPRPELVKEIINSKPFEDLKEHFQISPVVFGAGVLTGKDIDSLHFDQPATDLNLPIEHTANAGRDGRTAFALLVSDGDYNAGRNPIDAARNLPFPIYSIGVGDSTAPNDVVVKQVITAPSIYAGKKSVVKAIIGSIGYGGVAVTARLLEDGREIGSKVVTLPGEGNTEVSFNYTPVSAGTHLLRVYIPPLAGEFSRMNNSASVSAQVKKGKYAILLIAGEPAADVAFLRRNIQESEDFNLSVLIQKTGDSFNERNAASILARKYDAVVLYDFPNGESVGTLGDVKAMLQSTGVPYAFFAGNKFSSAKVNGFPRLPFIATGLQAGEFQVGVYLSGAESIPAGLQPVYTLLNANSNLFPPLYYQRILCRPLPGATVLAFPVLNGVRLDMPLFIFDPATRTAAFLAYGLWRFQLMSSLSGLRSDFLRNFLTTFLRALISGGEQRLLTVNTSRKVYDPSEPVDFNALLVAQNGSPVNDANLDVNIKDDLSRRTVSDIRLASNGDGGYTGGVEGLGQGKYLFTAKAGTGSTFLGADSGSFIVEPLNAEFVQTSMNVQLLRQLASVTGGQFLTARNFVRQGIELKPEWREPLRIDLSNRFEILSSIPVLAIAFLLLAVEWITRKIWGLP